MLGNPEVCDLPDGAYVLKRRDRTVSLRPGIAGELHTVDAACLAENGTARPVIFVNIVECDLCITPSETDLRVVEEIANQLAK